MKSDGLPYHNRASSLLEAYEINLASSLKKNMYQLLEKLQQEYNVDPIGFREDVRVQYPEYFDKISWTDEFPKINFLFDIQVKLDRWGILKLS
jgi:hypothetical protein